MLTTNKRLRCNTPIGVMYFRNIKHMRGDYVRIYYHYCTYPLTSMMGSLYMAKQISLTRELLVINLINNKTRAFWQKVIDLIYVKRYSIEDIQKLLKKSRRRYISAELLND